MRCYNTAKAVIGLIYETNQIPLRRIIIFVCLHGKRNCARGKRFSKLQPSDYSSITLPPLDLLFENAKSAPTYELASVKEQIERKLLAKEKRAFLGFFSLRGSYQYGMFGNESTYTDVAIAPYLTYATQAQNGYTVGAGVNIPLDGLFDLTARVKRQKLNVRTAQLEKEVKFEEMKKEIILLYALRPPN